MKEVNLLSVLNADKSLSEPLRSNFFEHYGIKEKLGEFQDLDVLVNELLVHRLEISMLDSFYLGYLIPQISKEFDLLRIGDSNIINIELKSVNTGEAILKQLLRNKYYLSFFKKDIRLFSFVSSEKKLYTLERNSELKEFDIKELAKLLHRQKIEEVENIDKLFNPSNYLVSPFNSTNNFLEKKYFLTGQQEEFKKSILLGINMAEASYFSISGEAGTGKTLLIYDIARELKENNKRVLIVHVGNLNEGHFFLIDAFQWEIISIKQYKETDFSTYDLVIIDETQRIYPKQLRDIISKIDAIGNNCIFSHDIKQVLQKSEEENNIPELIKKETKAQSFRLSKKIRSNLHITSFISSLFNKSINNKAIDKSCIEIKFFDSYQVTKAYLNFKTEKGWKAINYTPSSFNKYPYDSYAIDFTESVHGVIGQEFDKVIAVIDDHLSYEGNELGTVKRGKKFYYSLDKMLFQTMTRAKNKLCIVIINNPSVLDRCLSILNGQ
ncbi:DNA/RNA helicase domain-containing protein [Mongoliibacter ruber]|uniref:Uncharacterized protein DUF2075 n=1 Tax=Mongoliibacter ruber TaxID=1750599 RepID=A0A2T0WV90_9BACT|nr:DNA/RNA helicase domain-containing protein [Mongoliibacter ruber]PRY90597.1 uncharacterized protein DUF2075 [Mongoliibacter ruber]